MKDVRIHNGQERDAGAALAEFDKLCQEVSRNAIEAHIAIQDLAETATDPQQAHVLSVLASVRLSQASILMILQSGIHAMSDMVQELAAAEASPLRAREDISLGRRSA